MAFHGINEADNFTKNLDPNSFERHVGAMMGNDNYLKQKEG